jgi:polysaccharide export outer membrane protein
MIARKMAIWLLAGAIILPGSLAAGARLSPIGATTPSAYRLGAGDEIRVSVYGLDPLTNSYLVSDTGTISMPLLPPVSVEGKTVAETEMAVVDAIRAKQLVNAPSVSAQVVKYRPFFILGEVQRPGQYPYMPGMSLLTAVSVAGGYTFRADTKHARITRRSGSGTVEGRADPTTSIQPGDTILVKESWF